MKIHFASAFPLQYFCQGWQDFILRASVFTLGTLAKALARIKLVKLYCKNFVAQLLLYAMQCALFSHLLVTLIDYMIFWSPFLDVRRMSMSTVSFLSQLDSGILCL